MKALSIAQMVNRCYSFHAQCLRLRGEGKAVDHPSWTASDYRGARTALSTLHRWGCLDENGITERGRELLAALDARSGR